MKILNMLLVVGIALLSVAAGLAKVMQTPQEMEFLQGVGLSTVLIVIFGMVQIVGGVLLVPRITRLPGAILATSALVLSTVLIFVGGNLTFGLFSILPVALAAVIIYQSSRSTHNKVVDTGAGDTGVS